MSTRIVRKQKSDGAGSSLGLCLKLGALALCAFAMSRAGVGPAHASEASGATPNAPALGQASTTDGGPDPSLSDSERALALGAAVFPGVLLHGSGSYVLGRGDTAMPLLAMDLGGLGLLAVSGGSLYFAGAARNLSGLAVAGVVSGGALFFISWLADVYAITAPEGGYGRAADRAPALETELGYRYVYDPRFDYRHFMVSRMTVWQERWRLTPSLWAAPGDGNSRWRAEVAHRFIGPTRGRSSQDGSFLDVQIAATEHQFPRQYFALSTAEWMLQSRLDLQRLGPHLAGAFGELGVGTAFQVTRFDLAGARSMSSTLLLARFAFGIYLGDQRRGGGEWRVSYDHRHDDFAAGLLMPGIGSGPAGHIGIDGYHFFDEHWGLGMEASVGSAVVAGLSARFRHWGTP